MTTAVLIALLLAGVVVLTPLSDRLRVPSPVLLTMFGLLVPVLPLIAEITCMINGLLWPAEALSLPWRRAR